MNVLSLVAACLFAANTALHLFFIIKKLEKPRRVTKLLLMPLLALGLIAAYTPQKPPWLIVAALVMGCSGDAAMLFPRHRIGFPLGIAAFSAGHVLYLAQLLPLMSVPPWWFIASAVIVYGAGVAMTFIKLLPVLPKKYRPLCLMYMLLLSFFSAASASCVVSGGIHTGNGVVFVGTLLFLLSDTILSFEIFQGDTKWGNIKVMSTYIAAQACLSIGFYVWLN